jgi:hypothetical protein
MHKYRVRVPKINYLHSAQEYHHFQVEDNREPGVSR